MSHLHVEKLLSLLRGQRVPFYLIPGSTSLIEPSLYPYEADRIPIQCIFTDKPVGSSNAFSSGNRSIVQHSHGDLWLKAKAIGIPTGDSRSIITDETIYAYYLFDTNLGSGQMIWGLSTVDQSENELSRIIHAREQGLPAPKPVGIGYYENVKVLDLKDRRTLFDMLESTTREDLIRHFKSSGRPMRAACLFIAQPTDVRVDEILYGFLHPCIHQLIEPQEGKDFLKWLGSSCGSNLRMHHDAGITHGTIPARIRTTGLYTNSTTVNHLVDEKGTYITDYDMENIPGDKEIESSEVFFLASLMNPLPKAYELARKVLVKREKLPRSTLLARIRAKHLQEEFSKAFLQGVKSGYDEKEVMQVERELRSRALLTAAACKRNLFKLLELPHGMQRGYQVVPSMLSEIKFTEQELRDSLENVEKALQT